MLLVILTLRVILGGQANKEPTTPSTAVKEIPGHSQAGPQPDTTLTLAGR
jgi:hypothetical protein